VRASPYIAVLLPPIASLLMLLPARLIPTSLIRSRCRPWTRRTETSPSAPFPRTAASSASSTTRLRRRRRCTVAVAARPRASMAVSSHPRDYKVRASPYIAVPLPTRIASLLTPFRDRLIPSSLVQSRCHPWTRVTATGRTGTSPSAPFPCTTKGPLSPLFLMSFYTSKMISSTRILPFAQKRCFCCCSCYHACLADLSKSL
jgi:hypothetical protein